MIKSWIWIKLSSSVLEKAMAHHSSTVAWRIPWTEEPGGLQSMGSWRVGHHWAASLSLFTFCVGEGMAAHSSVLARRIPGTAEPGGLPSRGSRSIGHDWSDLAAAAVSLCWAALSCAPVILSALPVSELYIHGIMPHVLLRVWLLSFAVCEIHSCHCI